MANHLTDNELMEIVTSTEKQKRTRKTRSVEKFIAKMNIKEGTIKVPTYKIFYEYRIAKHESRSVKLSKIEFFRVFNLFFKSRRDGSTRYYLLNDCFKTDKESLLAAKRYDRIYHKTPNRHYGDTNEKK